MKLKVKMPDLVPKFRFKLKIKIADFTSGLESALKNTCPTDQEKIFLRFW